MNPDEMLARLQALAVSVPNFGEGRYSKTADNPEVWEWLGKLSALVEEEGQSRDIISIGVATTNLGTIVHDKGVAEIMRALHRAIARVELKNPVAVRGTFIPVGNSLDAYSAISTVFQQATRRLLVIDPYLSAVAVTTFAVSAPAGVTVDLLADAKNVYPDLRPALDAFQKQYGAGRPLEARVAPKGALHDRMIIVDDGSVWDVSQSLKDLSARSPGAVAQSHSDLVAEKIGHYTALWTTAAPLP